MSLSVCPDCGHEVSTTATACPNCGRPFADPTIERNVVVTETPPEREDFPKWVFIPLGVLGVLLLLVLFFWARSGDDRANTNVNINLSARRTPVESRETTVRTEPNQVTVPPSSTDTTTVPVMPPQPQTDSTTTTTIPSENVAADKGTVSLEAKIMTRSGSTQSVKNEKFYLLKKDLESILSEADIKDETGQGLKNAFGLSVLYPERYRETRTKALNEIEKYIVYDTLTDSTGKAQIKDVKPNSYYLFGITKTGRGFAIWSAPVTITPGQNVLNLSPPNVTEVQQ